METIVRRTLERIAREEAPVASPPVASPPVASPPVASPPVASPPVAAAGYVIPCAIPPAGTPRYAEVMAALDALESAPGPEGEGGGGFVEDDAAGADSLALATSPPLELLLLDRDARAHHVEAACRAALELGAASLAVLPDHVGLAARLLAARDAGGPKVRTAVVAGYPVASATAVSKAEVARRAIGEGADEVQWMPSLAGPLRGDLAAFLAELTTARGAMQGRGLTVVFAPAALPMARLLAVVAVVAASGACRLRLAPPGERSDPRAEAAVRAFLRGELPSSGTGDLDPERPTARPTGSHRLAETSARQTEVFVSLASAGVRLIQAAPSIQLAPPERAGMFEAPRC